MSLFSKNLKWLRKQSGLNQLELATELGFTQTRWSGYETGSSKPNFDQLMQIIKYFGISATDLLEKDLENTAANKAEVPVANTSIVMSEPEHPYQKAALNKATIEDRLLGIETQLQQIWVALAKMK
jgi:transcriptional regulator with XRE-family HTH domain